MSAEIDAALGTRHPALAGRRVVVTRAEGQSDSLSMLLRAAGAEPIDFPCIAFAPPADPKPLNDVIARLYTGAFDWLVLTSATAVRMIKQCASAFSLQPSAFKIAAVGPATAVAARSLLGIEPAVMPAEFVGEALAAALGELRGQRVLLLNSAIARPQLAVLLAQAGAAVERVIAYRTVTASGGADVPALLAAGAIDAITFTSGSTVRAFAERVEAAGIEQARRTMIACIGPVTADVAREQGLLPTIVAASSTVEGLVESLGVALPAQALRPKDH